MAEVREFALPDLGEGLTEATIVTWMVRVGEVVEVDQPVVEVETAKAMVEVPCPYPGVITARYGDEGDEIPVGTPLVTVAVGASSADQVSPPEATGGDGGDNGDGGRGGESGDGAGEGDDEGTGSGNVLVGYGTQEPSTRRRRRVPGGFGSRGPGPGSRSGSGQERTPERPTTPRRGIGGEATGGSVPRGDGAAQVSPQVTGPRSPSDFRESSPETSPNTRPGTVAVISPLVRRLARENGVDLREVHGSGPDGLILRGDVEHAVRVGPRPSSHQATSGVPTATEEAWAVSDAASGTTSPARAPATTPAAGGRIPLRGLRGTVADKLSRSRREIPDATTWVDADATELLAARHAMNDRASGDTPKVSLLALLARICTAAIARYPELNSTVDTEAREVVTLDAVHLGFAAQTDRGLLVPVVRDAHTLGAEGLSREMARLTESARVGTLPPSGLTGGTFTLNNYGVFGVDGSTPIINHPEAAMLGVGRIAEKPWAVNGELAVRRVVQLSLTFDHRVCDGGTAGGFLRYVADCVEQPAVLLRTL